MLRALLLLLLVPGQALAGPWLRDRGGGFLSYSVTLEDMTTAGAAHGYGSLYAEYGARAGLTLGLDLGSNENGAYKAIAFAVVPLARQAGGTKITGEFGIGTIDDTMIVRPGIAVGRGFEMLQRPGWMSLETRADIGVSDGGISVGTDVTLGWNAGARRKWMVQLQHGGPMADPDYLRVVPSVVIATRPGRHVELGVTAGIENAAAFGLKLGVWHEF